MLINYPLIILISFKDKRLNQYLKPLEIMILPLCCHLIQLYSRFSSDVDTFWSL